MSTKYRDILYNNYHTNQSGRASLTDAKSLFEREKKQFEREILPKLSGMSKSARIFDLGCGSGSLLMALKPSISFSSRLNTCTMRIPVRCS